MITIYLVLFLITSCSDGNKDVGNNDFAGAADIVSVTVSGQPQAYTFNVGISSPDKGCNQYANWWEVISEGEELLYRRILAHSHVNEQPFVRGGGPVAIKSDEVVWIRAHMNNSGYSGDTFKGSVEDGFSKVAMPEGFAAAVEKNDPQPGACAF